MRTAARTDRNQEEIISALRKIGASVQPLSMLGSGVPDLLVGFQHKNFLIEIKDGSKSPSQRVLTTDQVLWHNSWNGKVSVAHDIKEALAAVGAQMM